MAAEVKKVINPRGTTTGRPLKTIEQKPKMQFAFVRRNYMILLSGLFLIIVGFILLSGGGSKDPNVFSPDLFSTRRMVIAPVILLLGYITVAVSIMYKEKAPQVTVQPPVL